MEAGARVGKYEVLNKLGQGGFGEIYVARDTELDRDLAIKFLRPEHVLKPHLVQRFLQEARAAARINHPGIVTVFECGQVTDGAARDHGSVFIAMELLDGETLAHKLARRELTIAGALELVRQLASALAAAHAAGIVHRDLKPQNVFLVADPATVGGERVKILDFGIAKLADGFGSGVQTHSMEMLGTPMYMSPEQCKSSAKVDARSDIYALGCILFEMVTGRPPFLGDSGELIAKHQLVAPPSARELDASTPPAIDRLLVAMLAKSPDDRPQAMTDVIAALDDFRDGRDRVATTGMRVAQGLVENMPTTVAERRERPARRAVLIAGGGVAVLAGIGIALATTHHGASEPPRADATQLAVVADAPPDPDAPMIVVAIDAAIARPDAADEVVVDVPCDADALREAGTNAAATGAHADAVAKFEAALACKPDSHTEQLAFMAGCNARDLVTARRHWHAMTADAQNRTVSMCIRNEINREQLDAPATGDDKRTMSACLSAANDRKWAELTTCAGKLVDAAAAARLRKLARDEASAAMWLSKEREELARGNLKAAKKDLDHIAAKSAYRSDATHLYDDAQGKISVEAEKPKPAACDADALREAGTNSEAMGAHVQALKQFERALACKSDAHTIQLAFMTACNAHDVDKAKLYWKRIATAAQQRVVSMCKRNNISEATLDAP